MNFHLVFVAIALVSSAMLLGTGLYQSVVVAPNLKGAPTSLEHARGFYRATNPGMFFRALVPATQLFLVLAIVFNWRPAPGMRWNLVAALFCLIATDVITFRFHYPRNDILFVAPLTQPPAYYERVVTEWVIGNYARVALTLAAVVLLMVSMIRIARDTTPGNIVVPCFRCANSSMQCACAGFSALSRLAPPSQARPHDGVPDSPFESSVAAHLESEAFARETHA